MKKSKFTDSQIMDALRQAEFGLAVPDICRELGISTATFYNWRGKYGGMDVSLMARMKELEAENARLRKMYVEEKIKAEIVAEAGSRTRLRSRPEAADDLGQYCYHETRFRMISRSLRTMRLSQRKRRFHTARYANCTSPLDSRKLKM